MKLNALISTWRGDFGANTCVYFWARKSCNRGSSCDKLHEAAGLDRAAIDAWVKKHNADTEVSSDDTPHAAVIETHGLSLAAALFHASPNTDSAEAPPIGTKESSDSVDASGSEGRATAAAKAMQAAASEAFGTEEECDECEWSSMQGLGGGPPPACTRPPYKHEWIWVMCPYHKSTRAQRCTKCCALNCMKCLAGMPPEKTTLDVAAAGEAEEQAATTEEEGSDGEPYVRPWGGGICKKNDEQSSDESEDEEDMPGMCCGSCMEDPCQCGDAHSGRATATAPEGDEAAVQSESEPGCSQRDTQSEVTSEQTGEGGGDGDGTEEPQAEGGESEGERSPNPMAAATMGAVAPPSHVERLRRALEELPRINGPEWRSNQGGWERTTFAEAALQQQQAAVHSTGETTVQQACLTCKAAYQMYGAHAYGLQPGAAMMKECALCGKQRCERCDAPGTPACACPTQEALHQHAINVLRTLPEGPALARGEASMCAEHGHPDEERMFPEGDEHAKYFPLTSLDDRPFKAEAQPHRVERERQKVRDAGHDPDWRPEGDATTLFKPGMAYGLTQCSDWALASARATVRMAAGEDPKPPAELRQETDKFLLEEAAANGPWYIGGKHYKKPIPLREHLKAKAENDNSVSSEYFGRRMDAGDPDQDICYQIRSYGLDLMLGIKDTMLTWHLKTFYADAGIMEAGIAAVENEMELGYIHELPTSDSCHISTYPVRQSPRFAVDEGWKDEEKTTRKIRSVVHYSHPAPIEGIHKYPEGNPNSSIDLGGHQSEITMGSGKRHFRNGGILKTSKAPVIQAKRDGQNAFRQVPTAPCDAWATGLMWPRSLRTAVAALKAATSVEEAEAIVEAVRPMHAADGAVIMGMTSAMFSFQRAMEVPNRHANALMRNLDKAHPPDDPDVVEYVTDRTERLGEEQGSRMGSDDQYCDDSLRFLLNDLIKLLVDVHGPHESWTAGQMVGRGEAKMAIFDSVFEEDMLMTMSPKKRITTDQWMEALGVDGSPTHDIQRYPLRKRPDLVAGITRMINGVQLIDKDALRKLLHQELWMIQMAPEMALRLASGWSMLVARTTAPSGRVAMSEAFREDQAAMAALLDTEGSVALPLVPSSYYPPADSFAHITIFQDASSKTGAGGWMLVEGKLHGVSLRWPMWLLRAMEEMRYSISPAEAWTEAAMLAILKGIKRRCPHSFVTDFTDNESARAAANRGRSNAPAMHIIAQAIARVSSGGDYSLRTMRVTTKENATSDAMSREGGIQAGRDLAAAMGVEFVEHTIEADDPLWQLIRPILESPPSPSRA